MNHKTAYIWGPVSCFSGQLAATLAQKGWQVHVATKGAFHVALSPLDLKSVAQNSLEKAFGDREKVKIFEDRVKYLDVNEVPKGTKYDALIFCGLPPNFDEPRVSRSAWSADNFSEITKRFKGTPTFVVSSLWGAVQTDGVVPEELECERRKPLTQFEAVCQQYETRIAKQIGRDESPWFFVRLPMISGSSVDGRLLNFTGPMELFQRIDSTLQQPSKEKTSTLNLSYNPDATMWFLPVDVAATIFWRLLEDEQRPRITNLVSTQSMLNAEWLQYLAKALGLSKAVHSDSDNFNLPNVLRRTLNDNVLVKTRGLFEVMGRYQQVPTVIDSNYFERILNFGRAENWGRIASHRNGKHDVQFTDGMAKVYFTEFLPKNITSQDLKDATGNGGSIGFCMEEDKNQSWVLLSDNGQPLVKHTNATEVTPKVTFHFTNAGILKLVQRKTSLEKALVLREARVDGNPMEILRACNFLKKFVKEHPYNVEAEQLECLLQKT